MPKQDDVILSALESRTRSSCLDFIRENPTLTVGEIQTLCQGAFGKFISTISLGELTTGQAEDAPKAEDKPRAARKQKPTTAKKPAESKATRTPSKATREKIAKTTPGDEKATDAPKPATRAEVNTRTPAGRQAFDEAVFTAVQSIGSPAGAGDIQKITGGANMQIRAACNRLIEAGRLSWSGRARGTRYFPA